MKNRYIERLLKEWETYGKIIIAADYDDTLSPWNFNNQERCDLVIRQIIMAQKVGAYVVIHTACSPDRYEEITKYLESRGLKIDSINKNPIDLPYGRDGAKIYANIFLDDRAGLDEALHILSSARNMYFERNLALKQNDVEF